MIVSYSEIILASCILILPLLYQSSHVFRYYLKFSFYTAVCMFNSLVLIPYMGLYKPTDCRHLLTASYACSIIAPVIGVNWSVRGEEYLSEEKACIIVSNHQSVVDITGMWYVWHLMRRCTAVGKKEIFYVWPFGLASWLAGMIYIPRMQGDAAKKILDDATEMIKKCKAKLWIFPEGTRRSDGQIHPFKKGAFHLAIKSQLPILPIVIGHYYFLDSKNKRFDRGNAILQALPPIPTEGKTIADLDDLLNETREKMSTAFHELNKELKDSSQSNITSH